MIRRVLPVVGLLGLIACGSGSPAGPSGGSNNPPPPVQQNRAPTISSVTVNPTSGIQDHTVFNFSVNATDPDGDSLTYSWNIAGNARTGQNVAVTFLNGGTFSASVTVSDGRGGTATGSQVFTVASMTGRWSGTFGGNPIQMVLTQTVGAVTGTFSITGTPFGGILDPAGNNRIEANGHVFLRCKITQGGIGFLDFTLDGTMQSNGTTVTGGTFGSGFSGQPFTLTLQP